MDSPTFVLSSFLELLLHSPFMLVSLAGIVVAIVRWQRHPRISLLTIVSLAISLILSIVTTFLYKWLPLYLFGSLHLKGEQIGIVFAAIGFVANLINAAALGLLLLAIFGERGGQTANR